ncbi:Peroxidase 41 [Acorus calamus]|uniref:peroxidase n=1 Tax=Acorus calamus TaxID=4465 RepID=A0AAV9D7Q0_ACOCL|nr:Peroxidase 41 [Acorus calamus]
MANTFNHIIHHFIFSSLIPLCVFHESSSTSLSSLSYDYYNQTCPNIEKIIYDVVFQKLSETRNVAVGALRIFFHDCFVEGCDASVLIASNATNQAEREVEINLSLPGDGYDVFFRAKRALELHCPGVVSCADVMAIVTRDLTNLVGGPYWQVQKGRKDGLISNRARVWRNLPRPTHTVTLMIHLFESKGLTKRDLVALAGAHSIGFTHCTAIMGRIYYNGTYDIDPTMNAT